MVYKIRVIIGRASKSLKFTNSPSSPSKIIDPLNIISWGEGMVEISAIIKDLKNAMVVIPTVTPFNSTV